MNKRVNVAVVGVGAVGVEMLRCLEQREFPVKELKILARSDREIEIDGRKYSVEEISPEAFDGVQIALFAGTEGEKGAAVMYAPEAVKRGAVVIDNGSDFRLHDDVPLVVPEVNGEDIKNHKGIIANPNCTTIQMLVAVAPIYRKFGIKQLILSSYQAASGAGRSAVNELNSQIKSICEGKKPEVKVFSKQLAMNCIPQIGGYDERGFTSEEMKTVHETRKMLHDNGIKISSTCVRVPVAVSHSESIYLVTDRDFSVDEVKAVLKEAEGVKFIDEIKGESLPTPLEAEGSDDVFVSRVRKDPSNPGGLWLWAVADNLRKGAALNAVQIAEKVAEII